MGRKSRSRKNKKRRGGWGFSFRKKPNLQVDPLLVSFPLMKNYLSDAVSGLKKLREECIFACEETNEDMMSSLSDNDKFERRTELDQMINKEDENVWLNMCTNTFRTTYCERYRSQYVDLEKYIKDIKMLYSQALSVENGINEIISIKEKKRLKFMNELPLSSQPFMPGR